MLGGREDGKLGPQEVGKRGKPIAFLYNRYFVFLLCDLVYKSLMVREET